MQSNFFRLLNVLYLAMIGGVLVFAAVAYYLVQTGFAGAPQLTSILQYVVPLFAFGAVLLAHFIFGRLMQQAIALPLLAAKLERYRMAIVIRSAMIEGAGLFSTVAYLQTGSIQFLVLTAAVVAIYFVKRPSPADCISALQLQGRDAEQVLTLG